jgi:hypothetical protein
MYLIFLIIYASSSYGSMTMLKTAGLNYPVMFSMQGICHSVLILLERSWMPSIWFENNPFFGFNDII